MAENKAYEKYEDLADGAALIALKKEYLKKRDAESLVSLLSCLKESFVHLPMTVVMSDRDRQHLAQAAKEHTLNSFVAEDEVRMRPEVLTSPDGRRYFPVFSAKSMLPKDMEEGISVFEEAMPNCIAMAKAMSGLNGIVLDAFCDPMIIPFDVAEMVLNAKGIHEIIDK